MLNPDLNRLQPYPFEQLTALLSDVSPPADLSAIPLSIGEPQHPPPQAVLDAFHQHLGLIAKYPTTQGTLRLREAIATWANRQFQLAHAPLDPERQVIPVNGTREAIFALVQAACDRDSSKRLVLMPNPFYQIYEGAALMAGLEPHYLPIDASGQPNYRAVSDAIWQQTQMLFICTPGNPTGAPLDHDTLAFLIEMANKHGFWLASDECYIDLYRDQPPTSILAVAHAMGLTEYDRVVAFHSLSKRSNLPGLRSGAVTGDAQLLAPFLRYRTYHGCSMSLAVQEASIVAWSDETHVENNRNAYRQKFIEATALLDGVLPAQDPGAGFYLWIKTPTDCDRFARDLYAHTAVTVLPGQYLGRAVEGVNPGAGFVRLALVAQPETCQTAIQRIRHYVESTQCL
jgi:N-succinyldiaminopimelate aminotransferase